MTAGSRPWRQRLLPWAALALLSWVAEPRLASADIRGRVRLVCPQLTQEQAAEVEARVRASMMTTAVDARAVTLSCRDERAVIQLQAGDELVERSLTLPPDDERDALVEGVEELLRELAQVDPPVAAAAAASRPSAAARPPVGPTLVGAPQQHATAPVQPASAPVVQAAAPPPYPRTPSRGPFAYALGALEVWPGALAPGASLGVGYRARSLSLSIQGGTRIMTPSEPAFEAREWHSAIDVAWQPAWSWGMRSHLGLGPSWLLISPRGEAKPRAGTTSAAWFIEAALTRPVWVGHWALLPSVAARVFGRARDVNVDNRAQLELSGIVPSLGLGLMYGF